MKTGSYCHMALLVQLYLLEPGRRGFLNHQFGILQVQVEMSYLLYCLLNERFFFFPTLSQIMRKVKAYSACNLCLCVAVKSLWQDWWELCSPAFLSGLVSVAWSQRCAWDGGARQFCWRLQLWKVARKRTCSVKKSQWQDKRASLGCHLFWICSGERMCLLGVFACKSFTSLKRWLFRMTRRHGAKDCHLAWWLSPEVAGSQHACGTNRAVDNLQQKSL